MSNRIALVLLLGLVAAACGEEVGDSDFLPQDQDADLPAYCQDVAAWTGTWTLMEDRVLELVNERRAVGANCDSEGVFGPAGPLTLNKLLRCSARKYSRDMAEQGFFSHTGKDGSQPWDRVDLTGYQWSVVGENLALGTTTPEATVDGWMESDGHCANIMEPDFTELGVGYFYTASPHDPQYLGHYWTQNFGRPR